LRWTEQHGLVPLPATDETVALYLAHLAAQGLRPATLGRRLVAISQAHKGADEPTPTTSSAVRRVYAGIRRTHGTAQRAKTPALVEDLRNMVQEASWSLRGLRDRALLLIGFAGAFRRSELVGLDVADLDFNRAGVTVTLRRSKTDQESHGRRIGIPHGAHEETDPVRAVQAWLQAARITSGPIFRPLSARGELLNTRLSARAVAQRVKHYAKQAGLDPTHYAGHSLRSGLATSAAAMGASERSIMRQTGHKSTEMVRLYIREGSLYRDNAAALVGL